jgi:hypothetical protein
MSISRIPLDVSKASKKQKEKILKYAADVRKFEVERFWQRSIFFWGFIAAAFVAYAQADGKGHLSFLIACFGLVCSIAWTLQNRGSKYWYEAWEAKVKSVEKKVLGVPLFTNREPILDKGPWGARAFSVTKLAIALSDFTALTWIALAVRSFLLDKLPTIPDFSVIAAVVTISYIALLFNCRQS